MNAAYQRVSASPDETFALGRALGGLLLSGDVLALAGPLGAGKTVLIKGVAAGLGVPEDQPVVSPTFVLIREYRGRLTLYHVDAYRLHGTADLLSLGLDEIMAEPQAVVAIEWADRASGAIPAHACWIHLDHAGPSSRSIRLDWEAPGRIGELLVSLQT